MILNINGLGGWGGKPAGFSTFTPSRDNNKKPVAINLDLLKLANNTVCERLDKILSEIF